MRRYGRGIVALEEEEVRVTETPAEVPAEVPVEDVPAEPASAEDPVETPAPTEELAVEDNAESLETDLIELTDDKAEQDDREVQVDEAEEVAEALESIAEVLKVSAANGGMDRYAAEAISIATQHMCARVGIQKKPMPAMESFGGLSSRVNSTEVAMEGIADAAAKIWASIIAHLKKAIDWAADFFSNVFNTWGKIEKRAKELESKKATITGGAKASKITNARLAKALSISGAVSKNIVIDTDKFGSVVKSVFDGAKDNATDIATDIADLVTRFESVQNDINNFELPGLSGGFLKKVPNPVADGFSTKLLYKDLVNVRSIEIFGGKAIVGIMPERTLTGKAAIAAVGDISIGLGAFKPKAPEVTAEELDVLTPEEIGQIAQAVGRIATTGLAYKNHLPAIQDAKKKVVAIAEKFTKAGPSSVNESFNSMRTVAAAYTRFADQPAASMALYSLNTCKALLDYVEVSIKNSITEPTSASGDSAKK